MSRQIVLPLLFATFFTVGNLYAAAEWSPSADEQNSGTTTGGIANFATFSSVSVFERADPNESAMGSAKDTLWKKKWTYPDDSPPSQQFTEQVDLEVKYKIEGNANNGNQPNEGFAKSSATCQAVVNAVPDNVGDFVASGAFEAKYLEGDDGAISELKIQWGDGGTDTLTLDKNKNDKYKGEGIKTRVYVRNISNNNEKTVSVSIILRADGLAVLENDAKRATVEVALSVIAFGLSKSQ